MLALSLLSMSDVEFAHPVQAQQWRRPSLAFMTVWVFSLTMLTVSWPSSSALTDIVLLLGPAWTAGSTAQRWREQRLAAA